MGTDIWEIEGLDQIMEKFQLCKTLVMTRILKPWLAIDWIWKLHPKSRELSLGAKMLKDFTWKVILMRKKKAGVEKLAKPVEAESDIGSKH